MIAELRALLRLDSAQYKAAAKQLEGVNAGMQNSIKGVGRTIAGAFTITAIAAGARAIQQWSKELRAARDAGKLVAIDDDQLDKIERFGTSFEKAMTKAKGSVVSLAATMAEHIEDAAAFWGAVSAGGGVSGGVEAMGASQEGRDADVAAIQAARIKAIQDDINKELRGAMESRERLEAEHQARMKEIRDKAAATQNATEKDLYAKQLDAMQRAHEAQIAEALRKEQAINDRMKREMLTGEDRVVADARAEIDDLMRQREAARKGGDTERVGIIDERMELVQAKRLADIEKIRAGQQKDADQAHEQALREREQLMRPLFSEREKIFESIGQVGQNTTGRDVNFDQYARMGGQIGGTRAGLGIADRQQQVAQELAKLQAALSENTAAIKEANDTGG